MARDGQLYSRRHYAEYYSDSTEEGRVAWEEAAPAGAVGEGGGAVPCKSIPPPPPPVATPEGWTEYYDTEASRVYYCHALSGATQWERPE